MNKKRGENEEVKRDIEKIVILDDIRQYMT